jgi:glycosyltransferase involved in cell wall biosynthesis
MASKSLYKVWNKRCIKVSEDEKQGNKMQKIRIAHILWSFENGGIETMLVNIANEQVRHADVSIVVLGQNCSENLLRQLDSRIYVKRIPRKNHSRSILPFVNLNIFLLKKRINVVHLHSLNIIRVLLPCYKKNAYGTLHAVYAHKDVSKKELSSYRKLFSISNAVAKQVEQDYHLSTIVCENGINCNSFKKRKEWSFENSLKIVQVGRIRCECKGQNVLLQAVQLLAENKDLCFTVDFIGKGEDLPKLEKFVTENNLGRYVRFLGDKSQKFVQEHLCDYDLLVQPSYFEGFGLTVAEAMAAKVPVLVSDVFGPMEVIDNGLYGDYFKRGDSADCAEKIKYIMKNGIDEKKMNAAYERVVAKYDVSLTAEKYLREYNI